MSPPWLLVSVYYLRTTLTCILFFLLTLPNMLFFFFLPSCFAYESIAAATLVYWGWGDAASMYLESRPIRRV